MVFLRAPMSGVGSLLSNATVWRRTTFGKSCFACAPNCKMSKDETQSSSNLSAPSSDVRTASFSAGEIDYSVTRSKLTAVL